MIAASFLVFLLVFVVIGLLSMRKSRHTSVDYLLAGRSVPPWLVALSAVATNNSGYMFIGLIGYTYLTGVSAVWMMVGWIAGDFLASLFVHKAVRTTTEHADVHSFGGLLGRWHGTDFSRLRFVVGLITLVFLGTYAAAQLSAGSKALQVLFNWQHYSGVLLGALIVLAYSFAGGIRASIWTDAAQSVVMIGAMGLMLVVALLSIGGVETLGARLAAVSPGYLDLMPPDLLFGSGLGGLLFFAGWAFAGYGVIGQPHIMIRFMSMDNPNRMGRVRLYYYGWFTASWIMSIGVGLAARVLLPEVEQFDAELALPTLALQLLPEVLVGVVLAGIFAATISTTDSLILSCSAALTRDFLPRQVENYWITKIGTLVVTGAALGIALTANQSVFDLVLDAWGVLASAFAPLLTVYALRQRPSEPLALTMVLTGVFTMYAWSLYLPGTVYGAMPGILAGLVVFLSGKVLGQTFRLVPVAATTDD